MKITLFLAAGVLCALQATLLAMDPALIEAFKQKLQDANPQARIAAAEKFADQLLQGDSPGNPGNSVLPVLTTALGDSEAKVRERAAETLTAIAYNRMAKYTSTPNGNTDLASYPALKPALYALIDDPDRHVSQSALAAYTLVFPVPPELQDKLCDRYDVKGADISLKSLSLVAVLVDGTPTPKAVALLERLADAPSTTWQVAQALTGAGELAKPPGSLLPRFVNQIPIADDPNIRRTLFTAIEKYGRQAQPYLEQLEKAEAKEADAAAKENMRRTIQAIKEAK